MSKVKGVAKRLLAAGRAICGSYAVEGDDGQKSGLKIKNRLPAARRALNGEYRLQSRRKPVVLILPVEEKEKVVFFTKEEAVEETEEDWKRVWKADMIQFASDWREKAVRNDHDKTVGCIDPDYCCGCGACFSVCPVHAIRMEYDKEGFLAPRVDRNKCTGCGLCRKVCPSINLKYRDLHEPLCYAACADADIRLKSSSGGMFTLLAEYVFSQGGVVCGAGYTEDFKVEHFIIESPDELDKLRKSKYVQADASKVYADIKRILREGRAVLFCGCGCQVAGLYAAIGNVDQSKLYTIDLMCHGGPSPKLFDDYLNEYHGKNEGRIESVSFRDKEYWGWSIGSTGMTVRYKDGTVYRKLRSIDPFYHAFIEGISTRRFCGHCAYAKVPRTGDITLADFWGVAKYNREYTDGKGTAIVSVNSDKGARLYENIKDRLVLSEELPLSYVRGTGQPFYHCFELRPERDMFFEYIANGASIDKAVDYALHGKYDVALYGVWFGSNYGSVATYYALHQLIRSFGLSVVMIDMPTKIPGAPPPDTHARRFSNRHYHITRRYMLSEMNEMNDIADTFVIGSDQVWNRGISKGFGYSFYFDFARKDKKKIAFSASFGHDEDFSGVHDRETISDMMKQFDGISVRESSGVDICRDVYGVDAVRVLDPVFVLDKAEYEKLADKATKKKSGKYLLAYILDPTPEKRAAVLYLSDKLGLEIVLLMDARASNPKRKTNHGHG